MEIINHQSLKSNYFQLRGYNEVKYDINLKLPKYLKKYFPESKNAKILDIGCGQGRLLQSAKNEGYTSLLGIDISQNAILQCKGLGLEVILINDITEFSNNYKEKKFDFIILSHVLEHIKKDDIIATLFAIRNNLLSKDGKLFIAVPNAQSNTSAYWRFEDFTHTILFTSGSITYVLNAAGFNTINFVNTKGVEGQKFYRRWLKLIFLKLYILKVKFWNFITDSHFHKESPNIYTWELRVITQ